MNLDLTITISVIVALCAIVSPILVALINNHHNYKIRKLELATDKKIEKFELFCNSLIKLLSSPNDNNYMHYKKCYSQAVIYMSARTLQTIDEIDKLIEEKKFDVIQREYITKICKELQKDLGVYKRRK